MKTIVFKLIVQPTQSCIGLLRFLKDNIDDISAMDVRVQIEKLSIDYDEDLAELLHKKGITRLPAMIAPDGQLFIGVKQIKGTFEKNIACSDATRISSPSRVPDDGDDGMTDFWMKEMFSGQDKKGIPVPRQDEDESDEGRGDLERRLATYQRNVPTHRGSVDKSRPGDPGSTEQHRDNIAQDKDDRAPSGDDDMDQRMLSAWMNNH